MVHTWTVGRCILYTGIRLLLVYSSLYFVIFLPFRFSSIKFFITFLRNCEAWKIETWYTRGQWADVSCILESGCCCLFMNPFVSLFLFLSNFQTFKFFVKLFSGRLKLGAHLRCGQMYCVCGNQAAAAYSSLYLSIFFLSNFQTLKCFVTLFSGTVRPRRLKLGTHVDSGGMYHVYLNHVAAHIHSFIFLIFLSNFRALKNFIRVFSETVRPRRLKLHTNVSSG